MIRQLRYLFETTIGTSNIPHLVEISHSGSIPCSSNTQPNMKIHWGNKLFVSIIFVNISHIILLVIMEIFLLMFLQISIGKTGLVFMESKVFPRFVFCRVPEENIGFLNTMTYNCAIPSNVLVERLICTIVLWILMAFVWNIICISHILYKARKTCRQLTWKLYSLAIGMEDEEHNEFINYMSLNGHLALLILQSNLTADDFSSFYAAIFSHFKAEIFMSTTDNTELRLTHWIILLVICSVDLKVVCFSFSSGICPSDLYIHRFILSLVKAARSVVSFSFFFNIPSYSSSQSFDIDLKLIFQLSSYISMAWYVYLHRFIVILLWRCCSSSFLIRYSSFVVPLLFSLLFFFYYIQAISD